MDISKLKVQSGVIIPERKSRIKPSDPLMVLLSKMKSGDCLGPLEDITAVATVTNRMRKMYTDVKISYRKMSDGYYVWMVYEAIDDGNNHLNPTAETQVKAARVGTYEPSPVRVFDKDKTVPANSGNVNDYIPANYLKQEVVRHGRKFKTSDFHLPYGVKPEHVFFCPALPAQEVDLQGVLRTRPGAMKAWFAFWPVGQYRIIFDQRDLKRIRTAVMGNGLDVMFKEIYVIRGRGTTGAYIAQRTSAHINSGKGSDYKYVK